MMAAKHPNRRMGVYGLPKRRRWGRNRLGLPFTEKPEKMFRLRYILPTSGSGPVEKVTERRRQIFAIIGSVKEILASRESDSVAFLMGESGAYYAKLASYAGTGAVFFRITNPEVLEKVRKEMFVERRLKQKGVLKKRNWAKNKLGVASDKKSEQTNSLRYIHPATSELCNSVKKLLNVRGDDQVVFLKGKKSENYYAKLASYAGTGPIFFKITNQGLLDEIKRIYP